MTMTVLRRLRHTEERVETDPVAPDDAGLVPTETAAPPAAVGADPTEVGRGASRASRVVGRVMPAHWTWVGVVLCGLGFGVLAITWGRVAAETEVHRQVPYLISGALGGLVVVLVGLTVVNVAVRQQDRTERAQQLRQLAAILEEVEHAMARSAEDGRRGR